MPRGEVAGGAGTEAAGEGNIEDLEEVARDCAAGLPRTGATKAGGETVAEMRGEISREKGIVEEEDQEKEE